ncbi:EamA family transporter [Altererythrobacter sp. B11]|uniref:EamA family transporter n=1 Tax=Altererythrobacter sp. B11 TaxID=2060312 RepID=UPI001E461D8D|nr:EamA family transporter [Altererythrobacter sp. B11]
MSGSVAGRMPLPHLLLAIVGVAVWGSNFVVVHVGLERFPPFTFAALRFLLASVPLLAFVPRPKTSLANVAAYGGLIGFGQFGPTFYAMTGHMSPGLASVLIQTQAFFTVGLAMLFNRERPTAVNFAAMAVSITGVALVAAHTGGGADTFGIVLMLVAAMGWAGGNIVVKRAGQIDMFALVVWGSLFAVPPLTLMVLVFEGPAAATAAMAQADWIGWSALAWQTLGNTLFGYAIWNWLLSRHPATQVAPLGLLVPIFGLSASAWFLGESLPGWKIAAAGLVIAGLVINLRARPKEAA